MSGNFTRLKYDQEAYKEELTRSTDPMLYRLDGNANINCNKCFAEYPSFRGGYSDSDAVGQQTDVESILRGVTKINTKSNQQQIPDPVSGYKLSNLPNCSGAIETEYTRYTYPSYDIRGLNVRDLRLGYPLHDPQCQIFEDFGVNTRLQAKDDHRSIWQIPFDQKDLMPTERLGQVKNCQVQKNCNYATYTS